MGSTGVCQLCAWSDATLKCLGHGTFVGYLCAHMYPVHECVCYVAFIVLVLAHV